MPSMRMSVGTSIERMFQCRCGYEYEERVCVCVAGSTRHVAMCQVAAWQVKWQTANELMAQRDSGLKLHLLVGQCICIRIKRQRASNCCKT